MKHSIKIISFVLIISLFCSCSNTIKFSQFTPQQIFSLKMDATKSGTSFSADIICTSFDDITLKFTVPEQLDSFEVKLSSEGYKINAYGIEDALDEEYISDTSCLGILFGSITALVYTNHKSFVKDKTTGEYSAAVTVNNTVVNAVFSADGLLTSLSVPDIDFSASFTAQQ